MFGVFCQLFRCKINVVLCPTWDSWVIFVLYCLCDFLCVVWCPKIIAFELENSRALLADIILPSGEITGKWLWKFRKKTKNANMYFLHTFIFLVKFIRFLNVFNSIFTKIIWHWISSTLKYRQAHYLMKNLSWFYPFLILAPSHPLASKDFGKVYPFLNTPSSQCTRRITFKRSIQAIVIPYYRQLQTWFKLMQVRGKMFF